MKTNVLGKVLKAAGPKCYMFRIEVIFGLMIWFFCTILEFWCNRSAYEGNFLHFTLYNEHIESLGQNINILL